MSAWTLAVVILVVALLIPTLVVATESFRKRKRSPSPRLPQPARSHEGVLERLEGRLAAVEDDVDELRRAVQDLREEAEETHRDPPGRNRPEP